ncbi:transcriptional regulator [Salinarchaeum sp. Harcht-Bsk1]|uniref:TetR/AcrR family transcriptional regulator n=1 Tax=Salinarchaeum sp. Harcht-Bsk1 TaxID=1333523 RepID=UPI0003422F69|nr:TetR/AcrR family transcriptional regulator [Salinarchaeum sp. Harcht-Bsk1]AGN01134.1 transcriptional regulator [Salinarchaeum sp. Harcht-Bsk1]
MDDPAADIMGATFRALCDHGYAELTMRDIAEESDRSKAALHYHYDDKEGLLVAFLDHMYDRFTDRVGGYGVDGDAALPDDVDASDPDERLRAFLSAVLHPPKDSDDVREFRTAMLEIKAQAPYSDAFRERIARFDAFVTETVTELVEAGQEAGIYRDSADPAHVAQFVLVTHDGADARHVIADAPVDCALASLEDYLDGYLVDDGADRTESGSEAPTSEQLTDGGRSEAGEE